MANNKNRKKNRTNNNNNNNKSDGKSRDMSYERFASISAVLGTQSGQSASTISETRLKSMIQAPSKNATQVAGLSMQMKQVNGMYKRIINYMSSILTYDHTLYPVLEDPLNFADDPSTLQQAFAQTAIYVDRLNPKFYLPYFAEKIFTNGAVYLYKLEDTKSVAYMELPLNYCRVGYIEDGVYRVQFDVTRVSDTLLPSYPKEVQNAVTSYKNGQTDKLVEGKWFQLSDKAVAFTLDIDNLTQGGLSNPPMANALVDALRIENAKDSMVSDSKLDNTKIVHSKIETDDKGRPLMDLPVVMEYHNALKRTLPEGAVAITNPFETQSIALNGTGTDNKFALLNKAIESLYDGAGISKLLFAGDGTSSQALERSIQVDCQWLYNFLLPLFANYYNYELKKASKKTSTWKIKFLKISNFDKADAMKNAKDQLSFGGSRLEYLASTGMTPLEVANMLVFEQRILSIDEVMVAKATSYTQSADGSQQSGNNTDPNSGDGAGRPQSDNPTDTTTRIKDNQN